MLHKRGLSMLLLILLAVLVSGGLAARPVLAQGGDEFTLPEGVTWDQVNAIARKIYCDTCGGGTLDECESAACRQWREEIAGQLGDGRSEDEIIDLFVQRYGPDVLTPPQVAGEFALPVGVTWDNVNAIARKMYCDVCEGVPLDECESTACRQWREEIARQLGDGRSEDEIIDLFVERYGADVAALPRSTADRLLAYAVPLGLALVVALIGGRQMQQMRRRGQQGRGQQAGQVVRRTSERLNARPVPDDVDPAYVERLHAELGELDS